ncbi:MAG: hypothetical protein FWG64_10045 [Firmicutes bacterium]|nr:hypothetical protein [Bacillota bacterium]
MNKKNEINTVTKSTKTVKLFGYYTLWTEETIIETSKTVEIIETDPPVCPSLPVRQAGGRRAGRAGEFERRVKT